MTVKHVAERLGVSISTVYGLVSAGKLGCHRIGLGRGVIRFTEDHIAEFLQSAGSGVRKQPTASPPAPKLKHIRLS